VQDRHPSRRAQRRPLRSPWSAAASALVVLLQLAACSGPVLPGAVQAGGTVALPLAGEATQGALAGYGSEVLAAAGGSDAVRGRLHFSLRDPASGIRHDLVTRLVTRAWPDPASEAALTGRVAEGLEAVGLAQILALVDVPDTVPPGRYEVEVRRERTGGSGAPESLPAPVYGLPLEVLPARVGPTTGAPTPLRAWVGAFSQDVAREAAGLVPLPKLVLSLPDPPPHAAEIVLRYPPERIRPRTVLEEQHTGRASIVWLQDDPGAGRITLSLVDPTAGVRALALVFEAAASVPLAPDDFEVVESRLYDAEGARRDGVVSALAIR